MAEGQLVYSVEFEGKPLIENSKLAIHLEGAKALGSSVRVTGREAIQNDSTYTLVTGKASTVRDHYNAVRIATEETVYPNRKLTVEARAYDDGVALRYVVPDQTPIREFRETQEETEFRISKDATVFALVLPHYRTMYESEYIKLPASAFANPNGLSTRVLIGCPLLMQVPGVAWMAITEADLEGNSSM
jgi:alpha-glucosidase